MNANRTVRGRVPARLSTRVIRRRSILVLLKADEMVKPPINNMIVGENMIEKTYLEDVNHAPIPSHRYLLGSCWRLQPLSFLIPYNAQADKEERDQERRHEQGNSLRTRQPATTAVIEMKGTSVAQRIVAKTSIAKQRLASSPSTVCVFNSTMKTNSATSDAIVPFVMRIRPIGVGIAKSGGGGSLTRTAPGACSVSLSPRRARPIICRQTVSRSHAMCSRLCKRSCCFAVARSPCETHFA